MDIKELEKKIKQERPRSNWGKGVKNYCFELINNIKDNYKFNNEDLKKLNFKQLEELALNGAGSWVQYSWGGCSLVYNYDILKNLFSPSIIKKYQNSDTIKGFHLLDWQARALKIAMSKIYQKIKYSSI